MSQTVGHITQGDTTVAETIKAIVTVVKVPSLSCSPKKYKNTRFPCKNERWSIVSSAALPVIGGKSLSEVAVLPSNADFLKKYEQG